MNCRFFKPSLIIAIFVGVTITSIPVVSLADVTYSYTGNNFTQFGNDPETTKFTGSDHIFFTFKVDTLLDQSLNIQEVNPTWWIITAGDLTFGSDTGGNLYLAIAPSAAPSSTWKWEIDTTDNLDSPSFISSTSDMPFGYNSGQIDQAIHNYPFLVPGTDTYASSWAFNDDTLGTWAVSATVPLPPAVWLLGSGLVGMLSFARKCKVS